MLITLEMDTDVSFDCVFHHNGPENPRSLMRTVLRPVRYCAMPPSKRAGLARWSAQFMYDVPRHAWIAVCNIRTRYTRQSIKYMHSSMPLHSYRGKTSATQSVFWHSWSQSSFTGPAFTAPVAFLARRASRMLRALSHA